MMYQTKIYNRLEDNFHLSNKKALFWNMSEYYRSMDKSPWDALPVTFHIEDGLSDPEFTKFLNYYQRVEMEIQHRTMLKNQELSKRRKEEEQKKKQERREARKVKAKKLGKKVVKSEPSSSDTESGSSSEYDSDEDESEDDEFKIPKNMWIVKPGENTNRGNGIQVCSSLQEVQNIVRTCRPKPDVSTCSTNNTNSKLEDNQRRTFILQKYIDRPLLIKGRKFDIRVFGTMTSINGCLKAYFYEDGYIRTSSTKYTSKTNDVFVHLTNDAVQKHADNFGKYESGNKLSYHDFQKYLNSHYPELNV
jgi:tubulin monoglycylase TTLL3/8